MHETGLEFCRLWLAAHLHIAEAVVDKFRLKMCDSIAQDDRIRAKRGTQIFHCERVATFDAFGKLQGDPLSGGTFNSCFDPADKIHTEIVNGGAVFRFPRILNRHDFADVNRRTDLCSEEAHRSGDILRFCPTFRLETRTTPI